jgi:hypothetical protein
VNKRGAIIVMSAFAAVWWIMGVAQSRRASPMMYAIGIVISGLMIALARRRGNDSPAHHDGKRRGRIIGAASAAEVLAMLLASSVLAKLGRVDLIAPVVAIIVGLHFLPLARGLRVPVYYLTAALLVAVGVAGTFVQNPPARTLMVCVGAAAVLWLTCGVALLRPDTPRS